MAGKKAHTDKLGGITLCVLAAALLSSCSALSHLPGSAMIFGSDEYIIYRLQGLETPATLAERFLGDAKLAWVIEDANEGVWFRIGQVIRIPLKERNRGGLRRDGYQAVPILCYHFFAETCKSSTCMPIEVFDEQMRYLKENGYHAISASHLLDFLNYRRSLPSKSVLITLDDGYRSAYDHAYPILKQYGFTATLLIYTDYVGISKSAITWGQLREMKADGFEVGSQTVSHCDLTKKKAKESDRAYVARIKRELLDSKRIIDKELKQNTILFAFPYGRYNQRIVNLCDQIGYKMAFDVRRGGNPFFADPLSLKRDAVLERDMESFIGKLETFYAYSLE